MVTYGRINSNNILGIQPGIEKEFFIIGAHYDTVQKSPGTDDNASAVSAFLEIAHCLQPITLKYLLVFCGFTLEEYGFLGIRL